MAVVDPVAPFRQQLSSALEEVGLHASEIADVEECLYDDPRAVHDVYVVTLERNDPDVVRQLRAARPDAVVLALLRDPSHEACAGALSASASASLARDAPARLIALAVEAALQDYAMVPASVVSSFPETLGCAAGEVDGLNEVEIGWLRTLANGGTVTGLAESVGYSEREMHRLLGKLYAKMNVGSRTAAIIKAARQGILI